MGVLQLNDSLTDEFCLFFTDMTYVSGNLSYIFFWHKAINAGLPHVLENYGCPGMSLKSPGKTQFFRFCLKCPGKVLECLWSMEFGFPWQSFSDQLAIFKSPPLCGGGDLLFFLSPPAAATCFCSHLKTPTRIIAYWPWGICLINFFWTFFRFFLRHQISTPY